MLPRWTAMEIEMMKTQLKEYNWIKEENDSNNNTNDTHGGDLVRTRRRKRKKRNFSKNPYCKTCQRYFKTFTVLAAHRPICRAEKEDKCLTEYKEPAKKQEVEVEVEDEEISPLIEKFELRPLVSCKDCKLNFSTTRELFEHRQYLDCLPTPKDEESDLSDNTDDEFEYDSLYSCNVCRGKFISRDLLQTHRTNENHWSLEKVTKDSGSLKKSSLIIVKKELEDFTFRSVEENEYSCTACNNGRIYYDPDDLLKHHQAAHSSEEIYCRYCSQKLNDVAEFSDHHQWYHDLLDNCRACNDKDDEYANSNELPPKPWCLNCCRKLGLPFQDCLSLLKETLYCEDCERAMPTVAHVQFHNCSKQEFPHILPLSILACPLCLEAFNSLRSLYRHVIKHNDVMSFRCNVCGRLHETWKDLKVHVGRYHSRMDMRLPKMDDKVLRKTAEDVIRRFVKNGIELLT